MKLLFSIVFVWVWSVSALAQSDSTQKNTVGKNVKVQAKASELLEKHWSIHFQTTLIQQGHTNLTPVYFGLNSLQAKESPKLSLTTTIFLGRKLWKGAAAFVNPEVAGGSGLSGARGVAGFVNGETFRIGDPAPALYLARGYLKQDIHLNKELLVQKDDINTLEEATATKRITLIAGKFSIADFFDLNSFSHDPRSQFFNWSLMSMGGWDYPANTRGYTVGAVAMLFWNNMSYRFGATQVPKDANGPVLDKQIGKAYALTFEASRKYTWRMFDGAWRLLLFRNTARMGNYNQAVANGSFDLETTRKYSRSKFGFGINAEQQLNNNLGCFLRMSWNDGQNETWAFTEIDRSVSLGAVYKGTKWQRPTDEMGLAAVANGISKAHQNFLAGGGYGFIIGDGQLRYAPEGIVELYYKYQVDEKGFSISPNYQFVINPAYNSDRGPVHFAGLRVHYGM